MRHLAERELIAGFHCPIAAGFWRFARRNPRRYGPAAAGRLAARWITRGIVVDIFDEIDEDLRAERAQQLLKRYGGLIIAIALLIVAGAGGWQAWRWWEARRDLGAAAEYIAAMSAADRLGPDATAGRAEAIAGFEHVGATAPEGYATLARLRAATLKADAGDLRGATALWDQVAADGAADPLLRDLASLIWVEHQVDAGDPALLEARLKPLSGPDNPWHALALEAQGLLDMRTGKTEQAKEIFRRLAQDATAPEGVRGRANGLLNRLGG
jgi:hypothetical protein